MLKKVLLAFDGSKDSLKATDYVLRMAKDNDDMEVEIIYVRETVIDHTSRVIFNTVELEEEFEKEAQEVMSIAIEKFKDSGIKYETKVLKGDPAEIICKEAEESGITEIVVGSRGMNPVTMVLIGSVTLKVLHHAPCTVIVAKK